MVKVHRKLQNGTVKWRQFGLRRFDISDRLTVSNSRQVIYPDVVKYPSLTVVH